MKCLEKVIEEIAVERDALRERVKYCEETINTYVDLLNDRDAEIATLKQAQEPVAEIRGGDGAVYVFWLREIPEHGTKLYTSAKTIQRDVDEELAQAESLIAKISGSALLAGEKCHKDDKSLLYKTACDALITVGYARSLLSEAPKPGEPA